MFYRTQITKTGAGYAVDTSGKRLRFIGNYPCQAGDYVWTDGTVIFGNISVKPQPVIFDEVKSGIPILASNFDSEGNDTLVRGYFDKSGNFKKYSVAEDNWIVNNSKFFKHGEGFFIDVEISDTGDVFTAEYKNGLSSARFVDGTLEGDGLSDASIIIKKNGVISEQIYLSTLVNQAGFNNDSNWNADFELFKFDKNGNWTVFFAVTFGVDGTFEQVPNYYIETESGEYTAETHFLHYDLEPQQKIKGKDIFEEIKNKEIIDPRIFKDVESDITADDEETLLGYYDVQPEDVGTHWGYVIEPTLSCDIMISLAVSSPENAKTVALDGGSRAIQVPCEKKFVASSDGTVTNYFSKGTEGTTTTYTSIVERIGDSGHGFIRGGMIEFYIGGDTPYGSSISIVKPFGEDKYFYQDYVENTATVNFEQPVPTFNNTVKIPVQDNFYILSGDTPTLYCGNTPVIKFDDKFPVFSNLSAANIGSTYFLGGRNYSLFKIQDGVSSEVANCLYNFRLRKLKNISKCRR